MPLLLRQPKRNRTLRPFLMVAGACAFLAYPVLHCFRAEQTPAQDEVVKVDEKQKPKARIIVSSSQARPLIDIFRLISVAPDTRPPTYTINIDNEEDKGPRVEHPLDAYSCVLEARIRLNDAIAEGQQFDETAFLRSEGCPSLGELLQSIRTNPTEEGFEALRILIAERSKHLRIKISGPSNVSVNHSFCELSLEFYSFTSRVNPLIVAAELAAGHETARTILMEGVSLDQEEADLAFFGFVTTKPVDQDDINARMELAEAMDNVASLKLGDNPTQRDKELFKSGIRARRSFLLNEATDETVESNEGLIQFGLEMCNTIGFGQLVRESTKK